MVITCFGTSGGPNMDPLPICVERDLISALKIKKICFSPKVSIQPCWPKSDLAAPRAVLAQFMAKKAIIQPTLGPI